MEIDVAEIDVANTGLAVAGLAETGVARASRPAEAGCPAAEIPAGAGRVRRRAAGRAVFPLDARMTADISTMPSGTAR